jgi:hypothetical protein
MDVLSIEASAQKWNYDALSENEEERETGESKSVSLTVMVNVDESQRSEMHCEGIVTSLSQEEQRDVDDDAIVGAGTTINERLVQYYRDLVQSGETITLKSVQTNL